MDCQMSHNEMKKGKAIVVIPIYKKLPSESEKVSIRQTLIMLHKWDVCLIYPTRLGIDQYLQLANECNHKLLLQDFNTDYFESIDGYNRLMMSSEFYKEFLRYEYILICQPDVLVLSDRLEEWCSKGYDYVGAPIHKKDKNGNFTDEFWIVGNGGFSLRHVKKFYKILSSYKPICDYNFFIDQYRSYDINITIYYKLLAILRSVFGYKNTISYWKKTNLPEDVFFSLRLDELGIGLKKPRPLEALDFAFEQRPSFQYKLNGNKSY